MKLGVAILLTLVMPVSAWAQAKVAEKAEPIRIEPLGPVLAAKYWNNPAAADPTRAPIANRHDYDRVNYAYRNTYGLAPVYGFYPFHIYPYYSPRTYYRRYRHWY